MDFNAKYHWFIDHWFRQVDMAEFSDSCDLWDALVDLEDEQPDYKLCFPDGKEIDFAWVDSFYNKYIESN